MKAKHIGLALACGLFATSVSAAELLVTSEAKSDRGFLSFDITSDGNVAGFEFKVEMPKNLAKGGLEAKSCVGELPKGFISKCDLNDQGDLMVFVFSPNGATLPKGVTAIGHVSVAGLSGKPRVYDLNLSDAAGNSIASNVSQAQ